MNQRELFDLVSIRCSKLTTRAYSTSFSLGIYCLSKEFRNPIYSIYGFVRFADEIVDTFHQFEKSVLLERFKSETNRAIDEEISLNPILNSFQLVVNRYGIDRQLVDQFLKSMETDLTKKKYDTSGFDEYILGSAEVVGLMCLRVFANGDHGLFEKLKLSAMKLGSAFQKINFLRDLKADFEGMGRTYFPDLAIERFTESDKQKIQVSIEADFRAGYDGIRQLPRGCRLGVYVAYVYYKALLKKIRNTPSQQVLKTRIRIHSRHKISLLAISIIRHRLNLI